MEVKDYLAQNYEGYEKTLEKILERNNDMKAMLQKILNNNEEIRNTINKRAQ